MHQRLASLLLPVLAAPALAAQAPDRSVPDRAELEASFSELLSNSVLVGHFTDDSTDASKLQEERYTLGAVTKVEGEANKWRLEAKIEYGKRNLTVPMVLDVMWAGDTPMITLTDYPVPMMGTFTARVLFYEGRYCGTWQGANHGGTLFGRIERAEPEAAEAGAAGAGEEGQASADLPTDTWVERMDEAGNWPSYRGAAGRGVANAAALPEAWDVFGGEGVAYKVPVDGLAHSSPVIWGDRVYLTTSVAQSGEDPELKIGLYGSIQAVPDEGEQDFRVLCLDKNSGETLWDVSAWKGEPRFPRHPKGSFAASTPATDGKRVVAFFGTEGLFCYDVEGNLQWSKSFGDLGAGFFMTKDQWGFAASPVLHGDKVLIQVDVLEGCFVAALDADTGEELWRTERDDVPTWCTPTVHVDGERSQVLCNGYKVMAGYDLDTGERLWKVSGAGDIPVPTPVVSHGNVYVTSSHGMMSVVYAIPLDSTGDLDRSNEEHLAWNLRPGTYMQTPLVYGDELYYCQDNGILHCVDAKTGEVHYKQRVAGGGAGFTPSIVAGDDKIYVTSEEGTVYTIRTGTKFEEIAVSELGENCMSTPAISGGRLYFRGQHHLFAIGKASGS